jgi:hypothetical protein
MELFLTVNGHFSPQKSDLPTFLYRGSKLTLDRVRPADGAGSDGDDFQQAYDLLLGATAQSSSDYLNYRRIGGSSCL